MNSEWLLHMQHFYKQSSYSSLKSFCLAQVYSFPENIIKYKVWMLRKLY